jgi:type I restriction enzyme R subunit
MTRAKYTDWSVAQLRPHQLAFATRDAATQEELRGALQSYVRLYGFLAQIMPFADADLEKLYTFGRFLLRVLPDPKGDDEDDNLAGEAELLYYRIQKTYEGSVGLRAGEGGVVYGPNEVGTGKVRDDRAKLSEIIGLLNERFGTDFTEADQLFFDQVKAEAKAEPEVVEKAHANPYDNFAVWLRGKLEQVMAARIDQNADILSRYLDDREFQNVLFEALARRIYDELKGTGIGAP